MSAPNHPNIPADPNHQRPAQAYGTPTAVQLDRALIDMLANTKKAPSRGDASSPDEASLAYALALLKAASENALPDALFEPETPAAVSVRVNATHVVLAGRRDRDGDAGGSSNESGNSAAPASEGGYGGTERRQE